MNVRSLQHVIAVAGLVATAGLPSRAAEPTAGRPARFALLVGVTRYPNLEPGFQLHGPAADVRLMGRLATTTLAIPRENIVSLSEEEGFTDHSRLPTRDNIDHAWHALGQRARPGDYILIYLSGHGSQQPQPPDATPVELDGMDEVFLPRDTAAWDPAQGRIRGAIVDDEIGKWLDELRQREISVWIVIDACHSGAMIRDPSEKARQVPPDALGIPRAAIAAASARGANQRAGLRGGPTLLRGGTPVKDPGFHLVHAPGIAAFYACYPSEVTVEQDLPRDASDAESHGLFTFSLCQELTRAAPAPGRSLTYRELLGRVRRSYAAIPRDAPQPLGEGDDLDREILGNRVWPARSSIHLVTPGKINAGLLRGLSKGSVLEVFGGDRVEGQPVGHVCVTSAAAFEAEVTPCDSNGQPKTQSLAANAACRPVYLEYGQGRLRVAADVFDASGKDADGGEHARLEQLLQQIAAESPLVKPVQSPAEAEWLLRPGSAGSGATQVALVPVVHGSADTHPPPAALEPSSDAGPLPTRLADVLSRIARARNLVRLAEEPVDELLNPGQRPHVELHLWRKKADPKQNESLDWTAGGLELADRDRCRLDVANPGDKAVDVYVFYVDSGYGIDLLFPIANEPNRVESGRTLPVGIRIEARTTGQEHLVVIALPGEGEGIDLSMLTQPTLEAAHQVAMASPRAVKFLKSPLGRLMATTFYGRGNIRGQSQGDLSCYSLQAIAWRVIGAPTGGNTPAKK